MPEHRPPRGGPPREPRRGSAQRESTVDLLVRAKAGDGEALEKICARYIPAMCRWASGRLPRWARAGLDTEDLVQQALLDTLKQIDRFEPRHEGALQAYVRQALSNRIRDEVERAHRRPVPAHLSSGQIDPSPSPLEEAVGREALARYEAALDRLGDEARQAVVLRIEMRFSYEQVAAALGKPSANAARMTVTRALVRLAKEMGHAS